MKIDIPPDVQTAVFQNKGEKTTYFSPFPKMSWKMSYSLDPNCEFCIFRSLGAPLPAALYFISKDGEEPDIVPLLDTTKHHYDIAEFGSRFPS